MSTPFIGQICFFPWNWAPQGWMRCDGTLYPIQQYPALYSLIGPTYGGDGKTSFGVPNLKGLVPVGVGTAAGSVHTWTLGGAFGSDTVTLNSTAYLPSHNHNISFVNTASTTGTAVAGCMLSTVAPGQFWTAPPTSADGIFNSLAMGTAYSTTPTGHENRQPYLVLNPCINWDGDYPDLSN
jgi:microcystin-dependent protein